MKKDFIKTLSSKLYEWTNNRWIISLSKNQGAKSVKEKQLIVDSNEMDEFKKTKVYKRIKDIFEDSKLTKIENIKL